MTGAAATPPTTMEDVTALSIAQRKFEMVLMALFALAALRSSVESMSLAGEMRRVVSQIDPQVALFDVRSMTERVDRAVLTRRTSSILAAAFALVALFLVMIGLYGVVAFDVRLRTREIAVRVALGAPHSKIFQMVLREAAAMVLVGVLMGVPGIVAVRTLLQTQLFATAVLDPTVLIVVTLVVCGCALFGCVLPARDAAWTDPVAVFNR